MKIIDLFERIQSRFLRTPLGQVEVLENPSAMELHREVFNSENLDGEYGTRGFYVPDLLTENGQPFYAFWSANVLHPLVVEQYGFDYKDVIKLYAEPHRFVIYYFNNPKKTSEEIRELVGGSNEALVEHLGQVPGLRRIIKNKKFEFEDYA